MKYFISYSRHDSDSVLVIADSLRTMGYDIWIDQLDIAVGQRWDTQVSQALSTCDGMILFLSSASVVSDNVLDEMSYVANKGGQIIPVLLEECDIPFRLARLQYIDLTRTEEPLPEITKHLAPLADSDSQSDGDGSMGSADASVGLAIGYYYNFVLRILLKDGFAKYYPDLIRHFVYVRPTSLYSNYQSDKELLSETLKSSNLSLRTDRLESVPSDPSGPLWFDHVDGIIVDIPRSIYPLRRSPQLLAYSAMHQSTEDESAQLRLETRRDEIAGTLLDRVEDAIRFQVHFDGPRVYASRLHFCSMENISTVIRDLLDN